MLGRSAKAAPLSLSSREINTYWNKERNKYIQNKVNKEGVVRRNKHTTA